jgi:hypothetical protein
MAVCLIRLVEDLVPYMDADVHDPGAAQLAAGHLKRKQPPPEALPQVCFAVQKTLL